MDSKRRDSEDEREAFVIGLFDRYNAREFFRAQTEEAKQLKALIRQKFTKSLDGEKVEVLENKLDELVSQQGPIIAFVKRYLTRGIHKKNKKRITTEEQAEAIRDQLLQATSAEQPDKIHLGFLGYIKQCIQKADTIEQLEQDFKNLHIQSTKVQVTRTQMRDTLRALGMVSATHGSNVRAVGSRVLAIFTSAKHEPPIKDAEKKHVRTNPQLFRSHKLPTPKHKPLTQKELKQFVRDFLLNTSNFSSGNEDYTLQRSSEKLAEHASMTFYEKKKSALGRILGADLFSAVNATNTNLKTGSVTLFVQKYLELLIDDLETPIKTKEDVQNKIYELFGVHTAHETDKGFVNYFRRLAENIQQEDKRFPTKKEQGDEYARRLQFIDLTLKIMVNDPSTKLKHMDKIFNQWGVIYADSNKECAPPQYLEDVEELFAEKGLVDSVLKKQFFTEEKEAKKMQKFKNILYDYACDYARLDNADKGRPYQRPYLEALKEIDPSVVSIKSRAERVDQGQMTYVGAAGPLPKLLRQIEARCSKQTGFNFNPLADDLSSSSSFPLFSSSSASSSSSHMSSLMSGIPTTPKTPKTAITARIPLPGRLDTSSSSYLEGESSRDLLSVFAFSSQSEFETVPEEERDQDKNLDF